MGTFISRGNTLKDIDHIIDKYCIRILTKYIYQDHQMLLTYYNCKTHKNKYSIYKNSNKNI